MIGQNGMRSYSLYRCPPARERGRRTPPCTDAVPGGFPPAPGMASSPRVLHVNNHDRKEWKMLGAETSVLITTRVEPELRESLKQLAREDD